jgi:hypothetical protein
MIKKILILIISLTMGFAPEINAQDISKASIEAEVLPITISVYESTIHIKNAYQMNLEIYDLTGKKVAAYKIDSTDKTIDSNLPKGCYILKIGRIARKVFLH